MQHRYQIITLTHRCYAPMSSITQNCIVYTKKIDMRTDFVDAFTLFVDKNVIVLLLWQNTLKFKIRGLT